MRELRIDREGNFAGAVDENALEEILEEYFPETLAEEARVFGRDPLHPRLREEDTDGLGLKVKAISALEESKDNTTHTWYMYWGRYRRVS